MAVYFFFFFLLFVLFSVIFVIANAKLLVILCLFPILIYIIKIWGDDINNSVATMCGVIQCDFPNQMSVFRWLVNDNLYRCIYICHDKDVVSESRDRQLEDGTIQHLNAGDLKPPHYHIIVKLPNRLLPETFSKRFGNYVNFLACADSREYARYLTHETFGSQNKARYDRASVKGDLDYYFTLVNTPADSSNDIVRRVCHAAEICGSRQATLSMLIQNHDVPAVNSLMSHAYFYNTFIFE